MLFCSNVFALIDAKSNIWSFSGKVNSISIVNQQLSMRFWRSDVVATGAWLA
jgi:hypothetical protein